MKRFLFLLLIAATDVHAMDDLATADLAEIDRQLNNPLTDIWSLTFQNNTAVKTGNDVEGEEITNNLFFQPFLLFEIGEKKDYMLTLRPMLRARVGLKT